MDVVNCKHSMFRQHRCLCTYPAGWREQFEQEGLGLATGADWSKGGGLKMVAESEVCCLLRYVEIRGRLFVTKDTFETTGQYKRIYTHVAQWRFQVIPSWWVMRWWMWTCDKMCCTTRLASRHPHFFAPMGSSVLQLWRLWGAGLSGWNAPSDSLWVARLFGPLSKITLVRDPKQCGG
jgi:hypothetical protein